jgi:hypothetical protein
MMEISKLGLIQLPNLIINGNFDLWQRGTSFSSSPNSYTADRFRTGSGGDNVSKQTSTPPTGSKNYLRVGRVGATGNTVSILQRIESANIKPFEGLELTVSFLVRQPTGSEDLYIFIGHAASVDNFSGVVSDFSQRLAFASQLSVSAWQKFTYTFTVSTDQANNGLQIEIGALGASASVDFELAQIMLNVGPYAAPFVRAGGYQISKELLMCHRYYFNHNIGDRVGIQVNTAQYGEGFFRNQMRSIPQVFVSYTVSPGTPITSDNGLSTKIMDTHHVSWYNNSGVARAYSFTADAELS